jgi:predicted RNA-binding protein associated with RNAse of E/G family
MTKRGFVVRKLDASGREVWRYPAEVVESGPTYVVLEATFDRNDLEFHGLRLNRGDRFVETYYSNRWYNVFAIYDVGTAAFKGWYCNIARPAAIGPDGLDCADLALDLLVFPDGRSIVLDVEEFEALLLTGAEEQHARSALEELQRMARLGEGPFAQHGCAAA